MNLVSVTNQLLKNTLATKKKKQTHIECQSWRVNSRWKIQFHREWRRRRSSRCRESGWPWLYEDRRHPGVYVDSVPTAVRRFSTSTWPANSAVLRISAVQVIPRPPCARRDSQKSTDRHLGQTPPVPLRKKHNWSNVAPFHAIGAIVCRQWLKFLIETHSARLITNSSFQEYFCN